MHVCSRREGGREGGRGKEGRKRGIKLGRKSISLMSGWIKVKGYIPRASSYTKEREGR